ncbi:hypothetical protein BY458DRAFT_493721 [Sporodiniella umbellata]|nr:hypothetical protein BY458DRAFT_493721 [Sporodiniella umbellata]
MPSWWGHQEFTPTPTKKQTRTPSLWETQEVPLERPLTKERVPALWECPEAEVPEKKTQPMTRQHTLWEVPEEETVERQKDSDSERKKRLAEKTVSMWVSFAEKPEERNDEQRGFEKRASSQVVIPNLRSYNDDTQPTARKEENGSIKHPVKKSSKTPVKKTAGEDIPKRSASTIQLPRQNAAVRARAEHAKQRQQESNTKAAVATSPMTQRLKQRASSGINWDTIKQERRKTLTVEK